MNKFQKNFSWKTWLRYFLSYFLIFTILILGFFFIIRNQLTKRYFTQLCEQSENQLENLAGQMRDDFVFLSQIDHSLATNIQLILSRYSPESWQNYEAYRELGKYISSNKLIDAICYMPKNFNNVISTRYSIFYENGTFLIRNDNNVSLTFDPTPYYDAASGQLIYLSNGAAEYLIYFPAISSGRNYVFFYILETDDILQRMNTLVSDTMPAIALMDENKQLVAGVNSEALLPYLDSLELTDGTARIDSSSLCVRTEIRNGFSVIAMISNDSLSQQINSAFASTYLSLFLLGSIGFLLVFFAMRITYRPLRELTQKIVSDPAANQGYLEQLDDAFSQTTEENQLLKDKLENYRLSIKKSLLDTLISANQTKDPETLPNIDQFFDADVSREIFAVRMESPDKPLRCLHIRKYFQEFLPGEDSCIILEAAKNSALFLINYSGTEPNKDKLLKELLYRCHREKGYLSAISTGSASPMDIPALCESVMRASSLWPQQPVADAGSLLPGSGSYTYPHDKLEKLSELLKGNLFSAAGDLLQDIFQVIGSSSLTENPLPDFFVRCVLVDMLTIVINRMNALNIKFKDYQELYYETLYFCRSCPYAEKSAAIAANLSQLLAFCEQGADRLIHPEQIRQMIEASYCQPDFSIYVLADRFHVSVAYISSLCKKELKQNFSDYLWTLRMEKAKELLRTTDMPIDEISVAVGYLNTSSFRRKFKQETGLTPSQFRSAEDRA